MSYPAQPPNTIPQEQPGASAYSNINTQQAPPIQNQAPAHPQVQPQYNPQDYQNQPSFQAGTGQQDIHRVPNDDANDPAHYVRDPTTLIAYLIPFPTPAIPKLDPQAIPKRFMIYTPPPPPLAPPAEGQKEDRLHKVQRKWQEEVRSAKTSTAKTASWKGIKSKATKGISWAMNQTTNSNLDFLGRVDAAGSKGDRHGGTEESDEEPGATTKKTVPVQQMCLIYPTSMPLNDEQMREEFVNTMLRTKDKAQKDTIIATGLMPVGYGIDILATLVWPFGGLGEIDTVWAYSSFRGAKTARNVTKRLSSGSKASASHNADDDNKLKLTFVHSQRIEVLQKYLDAECHKLDSKMFPDFKISPTETDVLEAIGWSPSGKGSGGETRNWEDDQWEATEVKDDLKTTFHKAGKEWKKWCELLEKNPEKAVKK